MIWSLSRDHRSDSLQTTLSDGQTLRNCHHLESRVENFFCLQESDALVFWNMHNQDLWCIMFQNRASLHVCESRKLSILRARIDIESTKAITLPIDDQIASIERFWWPQDTLSNAFATVFFVRLKIFRQKFSTRPRRWRPFDLVWMQFQNFRWKSVQNGI